VSRRVPEQQPGPFFKAENQHYWVDERFVSLDATEEADFVSSNAGSPQDRSDADPQFSGSRLLKTLKRR
jgi:hypothetical protein